MRDYGGQAVGRYYATVAQLVEHFIRNEGVGGSNPLGGSKKGNFFRLFFNKLLLPAIPLQILKDCSTEYSVLHA